jgi:hypothetical protein
MIFNALQRIEGKIEDQYVTARDDSQPRSKRPRRVSSNGHNLLSLSENASEAAGALGPDMANNHDDTTTPAHTAESITSRALVPHIPVIHYPVRQITTWPAVRSLLRSCDQGSQYLSYDAIRATLLEQKRTALLPPASSLSGSINWLARLHISLVKHRCDKFFETFNLANPILDQKLFSQHTLGVAINSEFGFNIESCLVLVVMALGSLGKKAFKEAGFDASIADPRVTQPLNDEAAWDDGLVFFNEARKRIGVVNCDNSVHSCQYYLLSG